MLVKKYLFNMLSIIFYYVFDVEPKWQQGSSEGKCKCQNGGEEKRE